jgi:hypothetical protein
MMTLDIPIKDRFNFEVVLEVIREIQLLFHLFRYLHSLINHNYDISPNLITGFECYLG